MSSTSVMSVEFYHTILLWNEKHVFQVNIWIGLELDKSEKWNVVCIVIFICLFPEYFWFWPVVETEVHSRMCFLLFCPV